MFLTWPLVSFALVSSCASANEVRPATTIQSNKRVHVFLIDSSWFCPNTTGSHFVHGFPQIGCALATVVCRSLAAERTPTEGTGEHRAHVCGIEIISMP